MNFKIESNNLNLTNYPIVAKHFEEMAAKGWLIHKIVQKFVFIYRKIDPEKLDFSIAPYEIDGLFAKKTKAELKEFKTVCKNVGWNYVTENFNLHIYYKEAGSEATPIQTDIEEEFRILEELGNKQIKGSFATIAVFLFLFWMQVRDIFTSASWMKEGLSQILSPAILMFIISETIELLRLKRFLKINKENIEMGDNIEYNNSKSTIRKIISLLFTALLVLFIIYIPYSGIVLNNKTYLVALVPGIVAIGIGILYRMFIKPSSIRLNFKKLLLAIFIILSTIISTWIVFASIDSLVDDETVYDIAGLKVLSTNDFSDKNIEQDGYLRKNTSILIPKSYEYTSYDGSDKLVTTEYADALNESLAKNLVKRYIKQAKNQVIRRTSQELDIVFKEKNYISYLEYYGLSESDYKNLKRLDEKEAKKMAEELMKERSITKDSNDLWNLDEVYFLSYDKKEIVIRKGKEVFYIEGIDLIEGKDFTDPELIKIAKEKLGLD